MEVFMMRQKEEGFLLWPDYFIAMSGFLQLVSICRTLIGLDYLVLQRKPIGWKVYCANNMSPGTSVLKIGKLGFEKWKAVELLFINVNFYRLCNYAWHFFKKHINNMSSQEWIWRKNLKIPSSNSEIYLFSSTIWSRSKREKV